jgi:putative endonuclease
LLYVGVTSDLARRAWVHKAAANEGFTKRYRLTRLVFAEWHEEIIRAIQREKNIKHWSRAWKFDLIMANNPEWGDSYQRLT